jgi:hypothetical protein
MFSYHRDFTLTLKIESNYKKIEFDFKKLESNSKSVESNYKITRKDNKKEELINFKL